MQQDCILSKKELCNTDSVFVTAEKISGFHVEVIFYTTYEKKKIASSELILQLLIRQTQFGVGLTLG